MTTAAGSPDRHEATATRQWPSERDGAQKEPKNAKIWPDQVHGLFLQARRLQAARTSKRERITDNTLIRIAIDGLLAHADHLHGDDERELRDAWLAFLADRDTQTNAE